MDVVVELRSRVKIDTVNWIQCNFVKRHSASMIIQQIDLIVKWNTIVVVIRRHRHCTVACTLVFHFFFTSLVHPLKSLNAQCTFTICMLLVIVVQQFGLQALIKWVHRHGKSNEVDLSFSLLFTRWNCNSMLLLIDSTYRWFVCNLYDCNWGLFNPDVVLHHFVDDHHDDGGVTIYCCLASTTQHKQMQMQQFFHYFDWQTSRRVQSTELVAISFYILSRCHSSSGWWREKNEWGGKGTVDSQAYQINRKNLDQHLKNFSLFLTRSFSIDNSSKNNFLWEVKSRPFSANVSHFIKDFCMSNETHTHINITRIRILVDGVKYIVQTTDTRRCNWFWKNKSKTTDEGKENNKTKPNHL